MNIWKSFPAGVDREHTRQTGSYNITPVSALAASNGQIMRALLNFPREEKRISKGYSFGFSVFMEDLHKSVVKVKFIVMFGAERKGCFYSSSKSCTSASSCTVVYAYLVAYAYLVSSGNGSQRNGWIEVDRRLAEWQSSGCCDQQNRIHLETNSQWHPLGSILAPVLLNLFVSDPEKGIECTLSKFADGTKLREWLIHLKVLLPFCDRILHMNCSSETSKQALEPITDYALQYWGGKMTKSTLRKLADDTKLSGAVDTGQDAIQGDLNKLRNWDHGNLMRFNKTNSKVLHLAWGNPWYQPRLGMNRSEQSCEKDLGVLVDERLDMT
ncbi:hypothetical protein TURU_083202 [Turdus rufiventris]|nr:hypothetical protein TURU_083202 [Turdus rufiventris]